MAVSPRPPVVTIMGHVDHGKTSLLDYIRKTKVAAKEVGGITQHIGAYQAGHQGKQITFIDTPGHAAFSKMRSRGAEVTDFVVLVVAANDGVKPQTIESIQHIKQSGVPFVVAVNKIDLPDVNLDVVKAQLAEHEVFVQGYGGSVEFIPLSAKTGQGVDQLLDILLLMAEIEEIKADAEAPVEGIVIESTKDSRRGIVTTVLIKQGTLRDRDDVFTQTAKGRVRRMSDAVGAVIQSAPPGTPVELLGFESIPNVGDVVTTTQERVDSVKAEIEAAKAVDFAALLGESKPTLPIVLKSDTVGTLQAIEQSLSDDVTVIAKGVGAISDSDILLAEASNAQVIGFSVPCPKEVQSFAESHRVRVRTYRIIYELLENLQKQVLKLLEPTIDEKVLGTAEILQTFEIKGDKIAGSKITQGEIKKSDLIHIKRGDEIIGDPKIKSMRTGKDEVEIRRVGDECGIVFTRYTNFQVGDTIVAYTKVDD